MESESAQSQPNTSPAATQRDRYRVLVVDDQADIRRLLVFFLQHSGLPVTVVTAADGEETLERVREEAPDLILLDVMMPDIDGFEVCGRLRADPKTAAIPVIMLTGLADASSRDRGMQVGADDYVSKPFTRNDLLARVRRLLEGRTGAFAVDAGDSKKETSAAA